MAIACDIAIILESMTRRFSPNEVIKGTVQLQVHESGFYNDLVITHYCYTHGKGNKEVKEVSHTRVSLGELQIGHYAYPFNFIAAHDPFTYHGDVINLDWCIEAKIKKSTLIDFEDKIDFILTPAQPLKLSIDGIAKTAFDTGENDNSIASSMGTIILVTVVAVVVAISLLFLILYGEVGSVIGAILASIFIVVLEITWFGYFLPKLFKRHRHDQKIKKVQLLTDPLPIVNQPQMALRISIQPTTKMTVEKIVVAFAQGEHTVDTSGSTDSTFDKSVNITEATISLHQFIAAAEVYTSDVIELPIPDDWPSVFECQRNRVFRELRFDIHTDEYVYKYKTELDTTPIISPTTSPLNVDNTQLNTQHLNRIPVENRSTSERSSADNRQPINKPSPKLIKYITMAFVIIAIIGIAWRLFFDMNSAIDCHKSTRDDTALCDFTTINSYATSRTNGGSSGVSIKPYKQQPLVGIRMRQATSSEMIMGNCILELIPSTKPLASTATKEVVTGSIKMAGGDVCEMETKTEDFNRYLNGEMAINAQNTAYRYEPPDYQHYLIGILKWLGKCLKWYFIIMTIVWAKYIGHQLKRIFRPT